MVIQKEKEAKRVIGNRIQEILDKKGMTQAELAEKTDMSLAHVNRIINGKSYWVQIGLLYDARGTS